MKKPSEFWRFFAISLSGLFIDLSVFWLLSEFFFIPGVSNSVSSFISISFVYFFSSKYAFDTVPSWGKFIVFVIWYLLVILFFSSVIEIVSSHTDIFPLIIKIGTIPVSFLLNYVFNKILFKKWG